jgi:hypothetical protein
VTDTLLTELRAHGKLHIGTGSLLYQDCQRFAISCDDFSLEGYRKNVLQAGTALPRMCSSTEAHSPGMLNDTPCREQSRSE